MRKVQNALFILLAILMLASCGNLFNAKPETTSICVPLPWDSAREATNNTVPENIGQFVVELVKLTQVDDRDTWNRIDVKSATKANGESSVSFNDLELGTYKVDVYAFDLDSENKYTELKQLLETFSSDENVFGKEFEFCGPMCATGESAEITLDEDHLSKTADIDMDWTCMCGFVIGVKDADPVAYQCYTLNYEQDATTRKWTIEKFPAPLCMDQLTGEPYSVYTTTNGVSLTFCGWSKDTQLDILTLDNYESILKDSKIIVRHTESSSVTGTGAITTSTRALSDCKVTGHTTFYAVWCSSDYAKTIVPAVEAAAYNKKQEF